MVDLEVAHANAFNESLFLQVDHVFPCFNVMVDCRDGPVHEVKIEVIELEFLHAFEQRFSGTFLVVIPQFSGDE